MNRSFISCLFLSLLFVFSACSDDDAFLQSSSQSSSSTASSSQPASPDYYTDILLPEVAGSGYGVQSTPAPSGSVYYFNDLHTAAESDVQMDTNIARYQTVKRYLHVSGTAVPDDSGYTDRYYHSVLFKIIAPGVSTNYQTLPVDENNRFSGYLYFSDTGTNKIYSFRAQNEILYPRSPAKGTDYTVGENYSTLVFYAIVDEAVPQSVTNLLPTRQVNNGNKAVRDYATQIITTAGAASDREKVTAVYNFLIDGDTNGSFIYKFYDEIYPGYLTSSYNSVFMASHFLARREGVCNDFSELFAALVRTLGFSVRKVSGNNPSTGSGHMWNSVYFEGRWWWLDVTWANNYVAGGNDSLRTSQAEWLATPAEKTEFVQEHDNTYTSGFSIEY